MSHTVNFEEKQGSPDSDSFGMEKKDKITLQINYVELIHKTDLNKLLPRLLQKGVFTQRSSEPYHNPLMTQLDIKRNLFIDIHRRGPDAFKNLIDSFLEIGDKKHTYLAHLLQGKEVTLPQNEEQPSREETPAISGHHNINTQNIIEEEEDNNDNIPVSNGAVPFQLTEHQRPANIRQLSAESQFARINLKEEPLKIVVKKSESFFDDQALSNVPTYRMRGKCRGTYLGINNMEFINDVKNYRKGAHVDEENLKELFKQMGFRINSYRNQTKYDMMQTIKDFANIKRNPSLRQSDCLVITIMSHGEEGETKDSSYVVTSDSKFVGVSWIIEQFDNENCPAFHNKPKIFIFQICRGESLHIGVPVNRIQADGFNRTAGHIIRKMTDMLLAFSTLPGDKSYRDIHLGTWYIQLLCEVFMNHAHDTEIEHLLKMVDQQLERLQSEDGNMQTSTYESRAFKRCFLHPGLSE